MTMKKGVFIFVIGLLAYTRSAHTNLETVWLKDVTTILQTEKRTLSDLDLPNGLTFHLRRGTDALTLNLMRNHDINPTADVYLVRKSKDGQSFLVKTRNLEKEDVAYYQDKENGAFITVTCVRRSNGECDRVIYGNIRIGDSSYDLRPADTDVTPRDSLEVADLLGKRYVLQDQANIQRKHAVENKEAAHMNGNSVEQERIALFRRFEGQQKQNHFPPSDATVSFRNVSALHKRGATDTYRQEKEVYHVKVAVLIDSGIWDLYSSTVQCFDPRTRDDLVKRKIRESYSHVMNGVNLRYKEIEDKSISISVILSKFIFFQEGLFPHKLSNVTIVNGTKYIDAKDYIWDLIDWDEENGVNHIPVFDNAMLFTRYKLYIDSINNSDMEGITVTGGICVTGDRTSIVEAGDYVWMVWAAAHELGHSLGAWHDAEEDSVDCPAEDVFIMTPNVPVVDPDRPYTRNSYIFSNCSVAAFKKTLKDKQCVKSTGSFYNMQEYKEYVTKQPGEVYTPNEQCHIIKGPKSVLCETVPADICHLMRCTDPETDICMGQYFGAASGTECGQNMWCFEERCVAKFQNKVWK